jgi:membrane protease YdiL (CAAX protease family)
MQGFSLLTKKPWIPLLVTSIIFSLMHYWNGTGNVALAIVISTFIIGFMLGIIALGDNGIETAMGIHIGNNLYVALIFNSADSGLPNVPSLVTSQPTDPFAGIPFMVVMALLTIVILFWNRKDDLIRIFHK